MDVPSSTSQVKAAQYTEGETSYTVPCGTPIPSGAICTCNCVAGTGLPSSGGGGGGGGCTCNTICTCNRICTCNLISSKKWKTDVQPLDVSLEKVKQLRPVSFDWTADAPEGRQGFEIGFIAEDLAQVAPDSVLTDADGNVQSVDYARLTTLLVQALKIQQQQIRELRRAVHNLEEKLARNAPQV
jgi:hypothetical protein